MNFRSQITLTKSAIALAVLCAVFSYSAAAQSDRNGPLDAEAAAALVQELSDGLPDLIDDEDAVDKIMEKWEARQDLAGKTREQILKVLQADVKSVVNDAKLLASIWKAWTGDADTDKEAQVETPPKPAGPGLVQRSAHYNLGDLLSQMPEMKQADSDLQRFQTELTNKGQQMVKQIQANQAELKRKVETGQISREDMEAGSDALYREDKGIKQFEKEAQNKIAAKREELLKPILEKLNTAVRDVAKQLGYAFVFDTRTQGQFYGKESLDLSEQVKKKLGIQVETPQKPAGPALNQRSAHYNAGALLSRMPEKKQADSDLQLFRTELTNKGAQMTMQYQAKVIEFQRKVEYGELPPVEQQAQQAALRTEQEGILKFEAEAKNKIAAKREELYGLILEKLNKAIRDVANELGYTFVFDSSTGNLLYADESLDLTEQVEKKLGIQVETPQKPAAPTLDQRSAYCNCKAVLSQMPEMKQADSDLQRLETQLTNKGDQMVNQYKANQAELKRKVAAGQISAKDRKAAEAALNTQIEGLQKYEEEVKNKIAAKREELYKPILEKANKAIRDVSKELGYILVFESGIQGMVYNDESLDLIEQVKKKLGIK